MNSRKFIATLVYSGLVLLLALGICSPRGVAGQLVSGVYKVIETTDLGTQMRVTMFIRLMKARTNLQESSWNRTAVRNSPRTSSFRNRITNSGAKVRGHALA